MAERTRDNKIFLIWGNFGLHPHWEIGFNYPIKASSTVCPHVDENRICPIVVVSEQSIICLECILDAAGLIQGGEI